MHKLTILAAIVSSKNSLCHFEALYASNLRQNLNFRKQRKPIEYRRLGHGGAVVTTFCLGTIVKTHPTLTSPEIGGFALIMLRVKPFQRGHHRTQNATPLMLMFANEINQLVRRVAGFNVECVFTVCPLMRRTRAMSLLYF